LLHLHEAQAIWQTGHDQQAGATLPPFAVITDDI